MHLQPPIVNPVMRFIGVADPARSTAFYHGLLGFEIRQHEGAIEAISGPARIRFGTRDFAPDNWDDPRPPGSSMLFFESADLSAMHAAIRARGGTPSEIEKVNWIKMRLFSIDDPDGHTLWFGQSYQQPDPPQPPPMLHQALPELPFNDVEAAVTYYCDVLGFRINYQQPGFAVLFRDKVTILLITRTDRHTGIGSFGVYIEDADALYAELHAAGALLQGHPESRPWGLRDFHLLDLEGNRITFSQPFE